MVRETHLFPVPRPGLVSNQQLNSHNALTKPSAQQGASLVEVRRAAQLNVLPLAIIALYTAGGDSHSGHKAVCVHTCSLLIAPPLVGLRTSSRWHHLQIPARIGALTPTWAG